MAASAAHASQVCLRGERSHRLYSGLRARPWPAHRLPVAGPIRSQSGFSLTEILVTTVLLVIGFLGLSAMTLGSIRGVSQNHTLTTATTLARDKTEQIMRARYDTVVPVNYPLEDYHTLAGYERFQRRVTITDNVPQANMKTVLVTVSWRDAHARTHAFTMTSSLNQQ